jgi:DNA-directed RNA polymerase subunit RPC12/RpoP
MSAQVNVCSICGTAAIYLGEQADGTRVYACHECGCICEITTVPARET